jgi:cation diffusion facilitator family transporter
MEPKQKDHVLKRGAAGAKVSTCVTVFLTVVKGTVGVFSGSVALLADALHSLADVFASLAVWLGLRISQRSPSDRFPYGFYRAETLAFLGVSVVVAVSGAQILLESVRRVMSPFMIGFREATLCVAAVSALVSFLLARYRSKVGKETNSQALQGEARHSMIDVGSSALVFVGVLGNQLGFAWAEPIAGFTIGLLVIGLGVVMGKDAVLVLLDACLKPELVSRMRTTAMEVNGVKGVHDIKVRRSGQFIFAEMHVEVDPAMHVDKAHEISGAIEEKVRESIRNLDSITLHTEPSEKGVYRIALPVIEDRGLDSRACEHFGGSPYFMFIDIEAGSPSRWFVAENPGAKIEKKRGIETAHFLVQHKADVLVTKEIGEGPYHVLRDSSVQIFALDQESEVGNVLDALSSKKLRTLAPVDRSSQLTAAVS